MKSQTHMRSAWFFRKLAQRWPPPPCLPRTLRMYFWIVRLLTLIPELEQLAADALGAPQASPHRHVADEIDRLEWQRRRPPRPRSPPPEPAEAATMPARNGLRLDDGDRTTPRRQQARADEKLQPVREVELRALAAASKNVDLVAKDG